ncbi:MAG: shikimate dehydrogenase, partial [Planctomycetes bacterium]|nr:shikimate dehydrogenase [Planctomycetota bacterium]
MQTFTPPDLYGIIGYPLGHSLSPMIHTTAFEALGLPAVLLPWPMPAADLPAFFAAWRPLRIRGCCVTMPHKLAVMPFLDRISDRARAIGGVNTIYWRGDTLCGENTDILGFMEPLLAENLPLSTPVLVLGAGGTARTVAAALREMGLSD